MKHRKGSTELVPEYWDRVGKEWAEGRPHSLWRAYSDAHASRLINNWISGEDLGCLLKTDAFDEAVAAGLYPVLKRRAKRVIEIDISSSTIQSARQRYPELEIVAGDIRNLPFADNYFDTIVSLSTLDHFETRREIGTALRELYRVLAPGGRLLLTLDNDANPLIWLRNRLPFRFLHGLGLLPYQVGKTCGAASLSEQLIVCGYRVHNISHVLHCPRAIAVKAAGLVERFNGETGRMRFYSCLRLFERLENWPTRALSGHYVAVLAEK